MVAATVEVLPISEPVSEAPSRTQKTSLPCPPTTFSKPVKRKPRPALSPASFMAWAVELANAAWVMPLALPLTQPALVPVMLTNRLAVLPERSMMSPPAPPRSSSRVVAAAHCRVLLPRRALNSASSTVTAAVCRLIDDVGAAGVGDAGLAPVAERGRCRHRCRRSGWWCRRGR